MGLVNTWQGMAVRQVQRGVAGVLGRGTGLCYSESQWQGCCGMQSDLGIVSDVGHGRGWAARCHVRRTARPVGYR